MRSLVFAALICLAAPSVAQRPSPAAKPQPAQSTQAVSNSIANEASQKDDEAERRNRATYEGACDPGDDKRQSDLCAQWKAADAAADAARWTYIGNWIGGVSGLLVLVAIGLAYQANCIARDTAKRQLRAYLYVELKETPKLELGGRPQGELWLKNGGQTPAHNVMMANAFSIGKYPFEGEPPPIPEEAFEGGGHHPPNTPTVIYCRAPEDGLTQQWIDAITEGSRRMVMYGEIRYEDIFGESHFTRYRAEFGGHETASGDRVIWGHKGNEAD